jgi:hypothetical protein
LEGPKPDEGRGFNVDLRIAVRGTERIIIPVKPGNAGGGNVLYFRASFGRKLAAGKLAGPYG